MPFILVNGARFFYETWGDESPGPPPIVLLHGATSTGRGDWGSTAPLLAAAGRRRVIVPDCRGHGQSENPNLSYSFSEMAADTAALVRALGYARAHIIGHSNGGNVAVVMLLEQPGVILTCVAQAANAYVSADIAEREPAMFEPERVAREEPEWMNQMIALHDASHGPGYWRDLLRVTLRETVSQPNYTPADLARVDKPVLVIQGELDNVNAPGRHAQFLAENIPHAELWLVPVTRHNPHLSHPAEWVTRVLDFIARHS